MKKSLAIVLACCAFALAMGLAACGGSSSGSAASSAASSASSAASPASAAASSASASAASSSESSATNEALERDYAEKAREMTSARDDYLKALKSDAESYPEGMEEALNIILDQDLELMTRTINEIYDSGVEWFEKTGGSDVELQAYKDKLAKLRDECLADIEQTCSDLRP